ncbi:hypothetical protein ABMA27_011503 [Loxostege sticticalis]|uniref:Uncharacterized protein n=1 Tax=Loxostege sticticalis TaxID=481309 RepID=A0ABR3IGH4_LOXSC
MKSFTFAFIILAAGATAVPSSPEKQTLPDLQGRTDERVVTGIIERMIKELIQEIRNKGLDPFRQEAFYYEFELPDIDLIAFEAIVGDLLMEGLSNIRINHVSYSVFSSRLRLDLSLPLIFGRIDKSRASIRVFNSRIGGKLSGSVAVEEIRLNIDARLHISIISGASIRSLNVDFSIRDIESAVKFIVFGTDLSNQVNYFLSEIIPRILKENRAEINKILEEIIKEIAKKVLL